MSELPIVKHGTKKYYFDARLNQLRNVDNPHDFIDLNCSWKFEGYVCPHGVGVERAGKSPTCESCEFRKEPAHIYSLDGKPDGFDYV